MTIHFKLKFEDLLALQKHVIQHSYTHSIKRMYFKWISSILFLLIFLFFVKASFVTVLLILAVTLIYFWIAPILYNQLTFFKLKKQIQVMNYSHLLGPCEMTFSDEGIERIINGQSSFFDWNRFDKIGEDDEHYFLYESDLQGLIIAWKWDDGKEEKDAIKSLIQNKLEENLD